MDNAMTDAATESLGDKDNCRKKELGEVESEWMTRKEASWQDFSPHMAYH